MGPVWFFASVTTTEHIANNLNKSAIKTEKVTDTTRTISQPPKETFKWELLITPMTSLLLFGLKWHVYDRKNKPDMKIPKETHPLFLEIEQMATDIQLVEFGTAGRTEVFRVMITEQYNAFSGKIHEFLQQEHDFKSMGDFRIVCRKLIMDIISAYELRWTQLAIPAPVMRKVKSFYQERFELLLNDIDIIALYRSDGNYEEALFYILTSIMLVLKFGITLDSVRSLKELNGELTGMIFNGKVL